MYCLQCGAVLPERAHFCSQCGTAVLSEPANSTLSSVTQHDKHEPLLIVKPRLVTWVMLARYIPLQINLTIIGALFFGSLVFLYHAMSGTPQHFFRPFIFFGSFFFLSVPLLIYIAYRKTINATYYQFYTDRLEYYDGFWTIQHKILYYKHITDMSLRRNLLQRLYGIGTLHFSVPSMGPKYRGLFVPDIEHSTVIFDQVQNIVRSY